MIMKKFKHASGFTLIDLMVAMVVIGIGLAITIPAMQNFTNDNRKAEQINKLVHDLTTAKNKAVNSGETYCVASTSATPVWDGGWSIADAATNTVIQTSTTQAVANNTLTSSTGTTNICFRPDGTITATAQIEFCSTNACVEQLNREKQLTVSTTGRISLNSQYACPPAKALCP